MSERKEMIANLKWHVDDLMPTDKIFVYDKSKIEIHVYPDGKRKLVLKK